MSRKEYPLNNQVFNNKKSNQLKDNSDFALPLILLLVIVLTVIAVLWILLRSNFETIDPITVAGSGPQLFIECTPGQCATDIKTGFKSCPQSMNDSIKIDPMMYICNSPYVCDNPMTPYALQSDGSTNIDGVCEPNAKCPCLKTLRCPRYIMSAFTIQGGTPYQSFNNQNITFPQITSDLPIEFESPATTFCTVPASWMPLATPGCNFISDAQNIGYPDIVTCMGFVNGCNGVIASPCLNGTLAFITDQPTAWNVSSESELNTLVNSTQMGCVSGEPCPCAEMAIFDTQTGTIICKHYELTLIDKIRDAFETLDEHTKEVFENFGQDVANFFRRKRT